MDRQQLQGLALLLLLCPLANAGVYQWRDEQGRLHFGDKPPEHQQNTQMYQTSADKGRRGVVHFTRSDFQLSEAAELRVREGLDTILSLYTATLGLDVRGDVAVNLHLISGRNEFHRWLNERTGATTSQGISGVYVTRTKEVAVWDWSTEEQIVGTILHESSHVILAQLAPRAPSWIHEGMAQYVQTLQRDNGAIVITPHPAAERIRNWTRNGELVSLRTYLNLPEPQWREMAHNQNAMPYSVAWATVYFLMSSPIGQQTLRRLLHDLEKNGQWPTADAFDARYPGGLTRMDYDFFRWAQGDMAPHRY